MSHRLEHVSLEERNLLPIRNTTISRSQVECEHQLASSTVINCSRRHVRETKENWMVRIKRNSLISYILWQKLDGRRQNLSSLTKVVLQWQPDVYFGTIVDLRVILYRVIYSSTLPVGTRPLQHLTRQSKEDQDFGSKFEGNWDYWFVVVDLVNRGHVFSNRRQSRLSSCHINIFTLGAPILRHKKKHTFTFIFS